ncbi:hypothetical protein FACS1894158_16280 [Betaproteobacteria bacterium]|nr:hypothetical protein FACS1894158_16280 [Betaproteobacteria bacterium]
MSPTLTESKELEFTFNLTQTKETRMKNSSFTLNLKSTWVVGLSVLASLGVCGVCPTQPHDTLA